MDTANRYDGLSVHSGHDDQEAEAQKTGSVSPTASNGVQDMDIDNDSSRNSSRDSSPERIPAEAKGKKRANSAAGLTPPRGHDDKIPRLNNDFQETLQNGEHEFYSPGPIDSEELVAQLSGGFMSDARKPNAYGDRRAQIRNDESMARKLHEAMNGPSAELFGLDINQLQPGGNQPGNPSEGAQGLEDRTAEPAGARGAAAGPRYEFTPQSGLPLFGGPLGNRATDGAAAPPASAQRAQTVPAPSSVPARPLAGEARSQARGPQATAGNAPAAAATAPAAHAPGPAAHAPTASTSHAAAASTPQATGHPPRRAATAQPAPAAQQPAAQAPQAPQHAAAGPQLPAAPFVNPADLPFRFRLWTGPIPEGTTFQGLTRYMDPAQAQAWASWQGDAALVYPAFPGRANCDVFRQKVKARCDELFRGQAEVDVAAANEYNGTRAPLSLIRGTRAQIDFLVGQGVINVDEPFFVVARDKLPTAMTHTVTGFSYPPTQPGAQRLLQVLLPAVLGDNTLNNWLAANGTAIPAGTANPRAWIAGSIRVQPVELFYPATTTPTVWWNVYVLNRPTLDEDALDDFRGVMEKIEFRDNFGGQYVKPDKRFKCSVCLDCTHSYGLCTVAKHPDYLGERPRTTQSSNTVNTAPAGTGVAGLHTAPPGTQGNGSLNNGHGQTSNGRGRGGHTGRGGRGGRGRGRGRGRGN